jgi:monoamine oxidase
MKTIIIGGGLSGLAIAEGLEAQGHDYLLLEGRPRFGGRIMTHHIGGGYYDMGPAWFWPGQPRIAALTDRLHLQKFDQYADGILTFENELGQVQRGQGFASMEGSLRLVGGFTAVTEALANQLPNHRKKTNAQVKRIERTDNQCRAILTNGEAFTADQIVLALPPRIAAEIAFAPALPPSTLKAMQSIATWMAGQAKAIAIYDRPFWRDEGLSGDAMSRKGPMVEIHDASPATGGPYALFGFIGVPASGRRDDQRLRQHLRAQFGRLFGPKATEPKELLIKDWAYDPYTATEADKAPLYAHPSYGLAPEMRNLWNDTLLFAGTEVASRFGGYIEGALEAAENALITLTLKTVT